MANQAWADDPVKQPIQGVVLELDSGDLVVDLGGQKGITEGDTLEIWRPLKIKHPVTGKFVEDRFPTGTLKVIQVRPAMAIARPEGTLLKGAERGDIVIATKGNKAASTSTNNAPTPSANPTSSATTAPLGSAPLGSGQPLDPDAQQLTALFDALRGADLNTRIIQYEKIVREKPKSRYAAVLYEEAQALRKLLLDKPEDSKSNTMRFDTQHTPPVVMNEGTPADITAEIARARGVILYIRPRNATTYSPLAMQSASGNHWQVEIPARYVQAPGFDYFIEAVSTDGATENVAGTGTAPNRVDVRSESTPDKPSKYIRTASVLTDFASYNLKASNDYAWQTEGYFSTRINDVGFRAVRSGFGVYRGKGGSIDELDKLNLSPRSVGLTYGYLEGEYAFVSIFSIAFRGVVGLRDEGVSGGGQGFLRIGNDRSTNLLIGGEFLGGIGVRGITQLEWLSIPRVPVLFRTEVTNQPAGVSDYSVATIGSETGQTKVSQESGQIGARVIAQVGYRFTPSLTIALRGSYQGRTINHAGPGGGASISYEW